MPIIMRFKGLKFNQDDCYRIFRALIYLMIYSICEFSHDTFRNIQIKARIDEYQLNLVIMLRAL